ncbi:hypothetical protein [Buchnera aphidicola]|uniref:hypothetical protein n=1 Tax=Buchnera aphidicola TaxID=9 RepID=UPI0016510702|nr:hypothetical protein [Buchnera aphidicola]
MFSKIMKFFFHAKDSVQSKKIKNIIDNINSLECQFSNLSDSQLKKKLKYLSI